jgi:hypothetical protein
MVANRELPRAFRSCEHANVLRASELTSGAYSARWGNWVVGLRSGRHGWLATVWRWLPGKPLAARHELAAQDGFNTATIAVAWCCRIMRADGAIVMVLDAPSLTLDAVLRFTPAPAPVD